MSRLFLYSCMNRIASIDFARGIVMIIMALDHVRDFIHINSIAQSPTDLSTTSPALFFTRWITYLCAPIFVFLSGTSAYLYLKNKGDLTKSRKFLLTRGLWLIVLEFTVVNFGLWFDLGFHTVIFEVIAAIGFGFIILSLLVSWSPKVIAVAGMTIIGCHNLLPFINFGDNWLIKTILVSLFRPTAFSLTHSTTFIMGYPPIPWLGIMLFGFASGILFARPIDQRRSAFFKIGVGAVLLFMLLRFANVYGDSVPWSFQKEELFTFLSFMNITKYPPSLLFCLITLGIMFLILALAEGATIKPMTIVITYGRVPLFYFILHFYLAHLIALGLLLAQGFQWTDFSFATGTFGRPSGVASGVGLPTIYLIWISLVVALYKPCLWFSQYKVNHHYWWLSYV